MTQKQARFSTEPKLEICNLPAGKRGEIRPNSVLGTGPVTLFGGKPETCNL